MALGKYARVDNRRTSSNYCSTVIIVVFVSLCLVGVWMMTSSSVTPVPNSDVSSEKKKTEVKEPVKNTESKEDKVKQFGDDPADLSDDATKGDNSSDSLKEENSTSENLEEGSKDKLVKKNEKEEEKSRDNSESSIGTDKRTRNGKDGETKTDNGDTKNDGDGDLSEKSDSDDKNEDGQRKNETEVFPSGAQSELLNETTTQNGGWSTQATESKNEKETQQSSDSKKQAGSSWKLCNVTAGPDFIPCLDNLQAIRNLRSTKHYEHRERHCPAEAPTCLVAPSNGYKRPVEWPQSREKIWYSNVPHTKLAEVKGHQNWVKVSGEYLTFPGGGTQFKHGAVHYVEFIEQCVPDIAWGKRSRVVLDVGCGVASFGGFLFDKDVLTMSLAPKDEHEAQVQFALERGIPAISAVMGTTRLPFPGRVFDVVHCARCRVPWHIEGGKLLLELNRVLRPGGFFVWSATPVYQKLEEDVQIWQEMTKLMKSMCWELVSKDKDKVNKVGVATFRKPTSNECYEKRSENEPPICQKSDDPNAAWYVPLQACMHKIPVDASERGSEWPQQWPSRLEKPPYWLSSSQVGVYGKPAPEDFAADYEHWKRVVSKSYINGIGINWSSIRNVMDMRSVYGGFAAALRELNNIWVMNVVTTDSPDTLPVIYERGLFGIYHDWCESFSTYPRSYDLLHADHLFSKIKSRCNIVALVAEVDRILRPEGKFILRDTVEIINEVENLVRSMHWEVRLSYSKDSEGLLCVQKSMWRPNELETLAYAI